MKKIILFILLFSLQAKADSLTMHFIKSPLGVNWRSPFTLTVSALKNQIVPIRREIRHSIGHVTVELNCESTGEHLYRGMSAESSTEERELLFKKKYGLGVLYHTFKGHLEKNQEIMEDLADYAGSSRLSHLILKIPPKTCQRLVDYAREYEERGYGEMYSGFHADPLKGEGAGCSAFAMSFLEVGGLLEPFMQDWKVEVDVPLKYVGGPLTGNRVSIYQMLRSFRSRWSNKVPHIQTLAWEPQKMHEWTKRTYKQIRKGRFPAEYSPEIYRYKRSKTVILDLTDRPTPQGSFWRTKDIQ